MPDTLKTRVRATSEGAARAFADERDRSISDVYEAAMRLAAAMPAAFASELARVEPLRGRPGTGRQFAVRRDRALG